MREPTITIPSSFVAQDTNVNSANSYCNCHTHTIARRNHNILLAQRVRKNITVQTTYLRLALNRCRYPVNNQGGARFISMPIYLTQLTQKVRFRFFAERSALNVSSTLDEDPIVYALIRRPNVDKHDVTAFSATVTADYLSPSWYYIDIPVPSDLSQEQMVYGRQAYLFEAYIKCFLDDTYALSSAGAITAAGRMWFEANASYLAHCATFSSGDIGVRAIMKVRSVPGGYRFYVDEPFNRVPVPGTDTVTTYYIQGINLLAYSLIEQPITDFDESFAL